MNVCAQYPECLGSDGDPDIPHCDDPNCPSRAPQQWYVCDACEGSGVEVFGYWGYEAGCGHGHMMDDERPCGKCSGDGGRLDDAKPDDLR